jgi:hypothetical protein
VSTSDIRAVTYDDAVAVTASDTVNDPNGPFSALQATVGGGLIRVTTLRGSTAVVYLVLGEILTLAVTRVWVSGAVATGIVGFKAPAVNGA